MRIAVVSDIHGNMRALEAVVADLKTVSPDCVVHGGDLIASGFRNADVVDRVRDLGWPGVQGNTDEMLWRPDKVAELRDRVPGLREPLQQVLDSIPDICGAIGGDRLRWLQDLPRAYRLEGTLVVHATPDDLWKIVVPECDDHELVETFGAASACRVVYGHIHRPYVRSIGLLLVANCGSVSMSYDGDPRASYLLLEDGRPQIRRVDYDVEQEARDLQASGYPGASWLAAILRAGRYLPYEAGRFAT
jgi:predicted phosphodiesterase